MIPFFVVTLLYVVPLKYMTGYFSASKNPLKDILIGQILTQGNTHLWFLPVLFLIFLLVYTLERFIKNRVVNFILLFVLSCLGIVFPKFCPIGMIESMAQYALWFYLGYCFESVRPKIKESINKKSVWWVIYAFAGVVVIKILTMLIPDFLTLPKSIFMNIWRLSICFFVYVMSALLARTKLPQTKISKMLRANTLGLYLYSDPLNYVVLFLGTKWFGGAIFTSNAASAAFVLVRFLFTSIVALAISGILRKCKVKYLA